MNGPPNRTFRSRRPDEVRNEPGREPHHLGRGGIKALLRGAWGLGWLTAGGKLELLNFPEVSLAGVRLWALSRNRQALWIWRGPTQNGVELLQWTEGHAVAHGPAPVGDWGESPSPGRIMALAEGGVWLDDQGRFCGSIPLGLGLDRLNSWGPESWRAWGLGGLWEVKRGRGVAQLEEGHVRCWAWEDYFACYREGRVTVERREVASWSFRLGFEPELAAFGPRGWTAWYGSGRLDIRERERLVRLVEGLPPVQALRWAAERFVLGCGDWTIRVLDPLRPATDKVLRHHTDWVTDLDWDSEGQLLYAAGLDGQVSVWEPRLWTLQALHGQQGALKLVGEGVRGLAWLRTAAGELVGKGEPWLSVVSDGTDLAGLTLGGELWQGGRFHEAPQARNLVRWGGEVCLCTPGRLAPPRGLSERLSSEDLVVSCAWEGSLGRFLGTECGRVLRRTEDGWIVSAPGHRGPIRHLLALSWEGGSGPFHSLIVSGGEDGRLVLWEARTLRVHSVVRRGGAPLKGVLGTQGWLVVWTEGSRVELFGGEGACLRRGIVYPQGVACCAVHPSTEVLAVGGRAGEIRCWDLRTLRHLGRVYDLGEPLSDLRWDERGLTLLGFSGRTLTLPSSLLPLPTSS